MKRLLLALALLLSLCRSVYAVNGSTYGTFAAVVTGQGYLTPVGGAAITVCIHTGQIYSPTQTCSPAASLFTDYTLTTSVSGNIVFADAGGNFSFSAAGGVYDYQVSGSQIQTYTIYSIVLNAVGGGGGTGCDISTVTSLQILYNNAGACAGIPTSIVDVPDTTVIWQYYFAFGTPLASMNTWFTSSNPYWAGSLPFNFVTNIDTATANEGSVGIFEEDDGNTGAAVGLVVRALETADEGSVQGIFSQTEQTALGESINTQFQTDYAGPSGTTNQVGVEITNTNSGGNPFGGNVGLEIDTVTGATNYNEAITSNAGLINFGDGVSPGIMTLTDINGAGPISGYIYNCSDCDTPTSEGIACTDVGDNAGATAIIYAGVAYCFGPYTGGGDGGAVLQTNGLDTSNQALANFINSTVDAEGLTITFSNPSGGEIKAEITGASYAGEAATAADLASYPALCTGTQFSQGLSSGSNNCATPSGSGSSPTIQTNSSDNSSQVLLNFETSTANAIGLTITPSNPSGGIEKFELTGTVNAIDVNGAVVPASATIVGTNSSRQLVDASSAALSNNTSGTAANLSGTPTLPNGTKATTQSPLDDSQLLATTGYADAAVAAAVLGLPFKTNGSSNTSQAGLNFINSTVNSVGLSATISNPATNEWKIEIGGSTYSGTSAFASAITSFTTPSPAGTALLAFSVQAGSTAMPTGTLAPGGCSAVVSVAATGVVQNDKIDVDFGQNIFGVTGYNPSASTGAVQLSKWTTNGFVNFQQCSSIFNPMSITPGAVTATWLVFR